MQPLPLSMLIGLNEPSRERIMTHTPYFSEISFALSERALYPPALDTAEAARFISAIFVLLYIPSRKTFSHSHMTATAAAVRRMKNEKSFSLMLGIFLLLCFKAIPHTAQCDYKRAVFPERLAQQLYMRVKRAVVAVKVVAPHLAYQFFARQRDVFIF